MTLYIQHKIIALLISLKILTFDFNHDENDEIYWARLIIYIKYIRVGLVQAVYCHWKFS